MLEEPIEIMLTQCSVAGALSVSVTYVDMIVLETRKPQKPLCHDKDG